MSQDRNIDAMKYRSDLKDRNRIVIKIGTSTITHASTGMTNLTKLEKLVRIISDLSNQGKEVILVSSGAIAVGRETIGVQEKESTIAQKQAYAAIGQGRLMMIYQKLFAEYNQVAAQVLLTKVTMLKDDRRVNAQNTFNELLKMGVIPIVNENDTVSTEEIEFGDNDTLSAIVASLTDADLLILLSDIDGLYTDDPRQNEQAEFVSFVDKIHRNIQEMGKDTTTHTGTGGMATKIAAAQIASHSGVDMVIANGEDLDNIERILAGEDIGTLFAERKSQEFDLYEYIIHQT